MINYMVILGLVVFVTCCIILIIRCRDSNNEEEAQTYYKHNENIQEYTWDNESQCYTLDGDTDQDYTDDDEDQGYVWDENAQDIKDAKERLQKLFPFTFFTASESDLYDSDGRFDSSDGNTYELAIKPGLGYEAYVLFERNTGKVIDNWVVVDENEEGEDKEHNRIAVMAKERLQSIFPGTSFVINDYWNDENAEFEEEPLACLISHDSGFHTYTVSYVEYMSDMSLVLVHDMQTGKLIDSFTC